MKPKLLIIDDDPIMNKLYEVSLKKEFEVQAETQASKGISIAIQLRPKAVLLDLLMPNVDGYEVLMQLRGHPGTANLPVICISGDNNEAARDRAYQLGAIGFIIKPPNPKTFCDDVLGFLSSMNSVLESSDKTRKFVIAFNEFEKESLIKNSISDLEKLDEKCIFLSWKNAEDIFKNEFDDMIEQDKLIFLKVKPSLITRFPFMQDLNSIVDDMRNILGNNDLANYSVILDEPALFFQSDEASSVRAKAYALNEMLIKNFKKILCFSTKARESRKDADLMNLARVIFGEVS